MSKENRVSDELAVQRVRMAAEAVANNINEFGTITDGELIVSLDTAMSAISRSKPVAGVEVKPLEWGSKHEDATGYLSYDAKSILGTYSIYRIKSDGFWLCERGVLNIGRFPAEAEAKAAAEADYRNRILSVILPKATAPVIETRNDEAGFVEFLNEDVWTVTREIDGRVAILLDVNTRQVVGYRVYDPATAPGVVITEEMVERACSSLFPNWGDRASWTQARMKADCRAALTAALKDGN